MSAVDVEREARSVGCPMNRVTEIAAAGGPEGKGDRVAAVIAAVRQHIRDEGLPAGAPLPGEALFAERCEVSRVVVREAFRSLSALGVIDVGNGRRARVGSIDSAMLATVFDHAVHVEQMTILQIYDVRRTLESRTTRLAALRATRADARGIAERAAAMRRDFGDAEAVMGHDIAFHAAIAAASSNPAFALIVGAFETVMRRTWPVGWRSRPGDAARMASVEAHEAIAEAIEAGDPDAAERAMQHHFDHSVKALVEAGVV